VADGNFKADHVRQNNAASDIWLSEGGGMIAKKEDYEEFLKKAVERVTVSGRCVWAAALTTIRYRKRHARIISEPLKWQCYKPKLATSRALSQ
jgi:hypothetical protein